MVDKAHIISEICRTVIENDGKALGMSRFFQATGIARKDWHGKYWARWGDAVREASFEPNTLIGAHPDEFVLKKLIACIREIGKYPTMAEIKMQARSDPDFPSHSVFTRLGKKAELVRKLRVYCEGRPEYSDVLSICSGLKAAAYEPHPGHPTATPVVGHVYLMKSGKFYKIGHSSSVGRREYELSIQLPEKIKTIHTIETDGPAGIEAYWHKRFQERRKNGEWFELRSGDVHAFRRRSFM